MRFAAIGDFSCRSALGLLCLSWVGACGSATATVPQGPHPAGSTSSLRVPYPPPPAQVEIIPLRRRSDCFWRDGYWKFLGQTWQWEKGAWLHSAPGCYYAPPSTLYESTPAGTRLVHREGAWYRSDGSSCEAPPTCATRAVEPDSDEPPPSPLE